MVGGGNGGGGRSLPISHIAFKLRLHGQPTHAPSIPEILTQKSLSLGSSSSQFVQLAVSASPLQNVNLLRHWLHSALLTSRQVHKLVVSDFPSPNQRSRCSNVHPRLKCKFGTVVKRVILYKAYNVFHCFIAVEYTQRACQVEICTRIYNEKYKNVTDLKHVQDSTTDRFRPEVYTVPILIRNIVIAELTSDKKQFPWSNQSALTYTWAVKA